MMQEEAKLVWYHGEIGNNGNKWMIIDILIIEH